MYKVLSILFWSHRKNAKRLKVAVYDASYYSIYTEFKVFEAERIKEVSYNGKIWTSYIVQNFLRQNLFLRRAWSDLGMQNSLSHTFHTEF